ncbi:MAG: hypothetical protein IJY04_02585 [Clostridia bacterium]|nr:hypothetical protein [Clostridia bacterium]
MPRGLKGRFTPAESGVYRITSKSDAPVDAWIFLEDNTQYYIYEDNEKLFMITEASVNNCSMVVYLEAGVDYYIDIAYEDVYGYGTIEYRIDRIGESYESFVLAAPGFFTYYEAEEGSGAINEIVALSIDVALDDDAFYREKLADGSLGSLLYAEFNLAMPIFSHSILEIIEEGGFNFALTDDDHYVLNYLKAWTPEGESYTDYTYDGFFKEKFMNLWGADNYATYYELYKPDEVLAGIYHGSGEDYTAEMRAYAARIHTEQSAGENPELIGCIEVDQRLAELLQLLMDKYTFSGVEISWAKLCFYYKQLPAPVSAVE